EEREDPSHHVSSWSAESVRIQVITSAPDIVPTCPALTGSLWDRSPRTRSGCQVASKGIPRE
ncbi:hypothetical protein KUCAC02_003188, partial [Chaenocephalus aceratus]